VLSVGDGIARVYGLDNVQAGEMVEFPGGIKGMALNLETDNVGVVIFGDDRDIKEGDTSSAPAPSSKCRSARACSAAWSTRSGNPIDGKGPIKSTEKPPRRREGAGHHRAQVGARADADRPQGHRRADPRRPRPARADHRRPPDRQDRRRLDTILNQKPINAGDEKSKKLYCIYVAIGQKRSTVAQSSRRSRTTARWSTPSSSPPRRPSPRRCSSSRPSPAAPWANTSATTACTPDRV
jgi:F-type H+/Na+-transporting ATPase subunit alpha